MHDQVRERNRPLWNRCLWEQQHKQCSGQVQCWGRLVKILLPFLHTLAQPFESQQQIEQHSFFFFCKMTAHTISCWEKYGMLGKCKQKLSFTRALSRTWSKGQEAPPGPSPSSLRHKNIRNPQHNLLRKHRPSSRAPRGGFLNLCIDGIRSEKTEVGKDVVHYLIRQCFLQLSPYIPGIVF